MDDWGCLITCNRLSSELALLCSSSLALITADSFWMRVVSTEKKKECKHDLND